ncbi:MAG TPA: hypothetical protein VGP33_00705 [Chloroflexota bacterium]|nr:hypothetical protein [Chloroflexota bacterium]
MGSANPTATAQRPTSTATAVPSTPTLEPSPTATATITATATPLPSPTSTATSTSTPTPAATATPALTATPVPTATPTRGPLRVTKLGLGVYGSGGAFLSQMQNWRPSVVLLMDPDPDFARSVRAAFPKAFIVGRRFVTSQPLDNPAARGAAFADYVAQLAAPLKGVVNAWMSYNEVTSFTSPTQNNYVAWNTFQVAFAQQLQGHYGIDAIAGNDGTSAVQPAAYVQYFLPAIRASHYFGVHAYPPADAHSMQQGSGPAAMLRYRQIHDALAQVGVTPPFILTETGLYDGWHGVEGDAGMAADFIWLNNELEQDSYVIGQTAFGLFPDGEQQWGRFNVANSFLETLIGNFNSCEQSHPCPPGQQG